MAQSGKKHMGAGTQGKGSGTGANTVLPDDKVGPNAVLSNRDKAQHTKSRGQDSKAVQNEQAQDTTRE
jgi:hypothetical protein